MKIFIFSKPKANMYVTNEEDAGKFNLLSCASEK